MEDRPVKVAAVKVGLVLPVLMFTEHFQGTILTICILLEGEVIVE